MNQISSILIVIVGGLLVLVSAIYVIPLFGNATPFSSDSSNLVSTGRALSSVLPIFAIILAVGVIGLLIQKK